LHPQPPRTSVEAGREIGPFRATAATGSRGAILEDPENRENEATFAFVRMDPALARDVGYRHAATVAAKGMCKHPASLLRHHFEHKLSTLHAR